MDFLIIKEWLQERLQMPLPGIEAHKKMMARVRELPEKIPGDARPSAVLSLLFPENGDLNLLLIKRTEDGKAHSGQISFPGGRKEENDADLRATALRETHEEVGIMSSEVSVSGALTPLYIPVSNFMVYPFVGLMENKPEYLLGKEEVARIFEVPVKELFSEKSKSVVRVTSPADKSFVRNVNAYLLADGSAVWGATAMILSELEAIFKERRSFR